MRQISLPLPRIEDDDVIEIEVKSKKKGNLLCFRIEAFLCEIEQNNNSETDKAKLSFERISRLKNSIENYDKSWELVQIFAPLKNSKYIKILYRKRL
jgi:hypothetical protein